MADLGQHVFLADLLRQLPPDVVDRNVLCFLDKPSRCNLKLASRELAGLVRSCRGLVTLNLKTCLGKAPRRGSQERQAQVLRQYTSARQLVVSVNSGVEVTAALVSQHAVGPIWVANLSSVLSESKTQWDPIGCMDLHVLTKAPACLSGGRGSHHPLAAQPHGSPERHHADMLPPLLPILPLPGGTCPSCPNMHPEHCAWTMVLQQLAHVQE